MINKVALYIQENALGKIEHNVEIRYHTTMDVGGTVCYMYSPIDLESLQKVIKYNIENEIYYIILGRGSNSIFPDGHNEIFVIKISNILDELLIETDYIYVGAGYSLQKLSKNLSKKGFSGLEFAGGIPGTVGGAIYMNAGAHLKEMKDIIKSVDIIDQYGEKKTLLVEECDFNYRYSIFQTMKVVIIGVKLKVIIANKAEVFKQMSGNLAYRKEMQPLEKKSCGSTFRNPPGYHAGKLIEECGLKGYKIGGAMVSDKHANFIINQDNATTSDVLELIKYVKKVVFEKTAISLHQELEFINGGE